MNFYFLCLVALVTILATRETLGISEKMAVILILLLFVILLGYQLKIEKFISSVTRKHIADDLRLAVHQKRDIQKTKKDLRELMNRLMN